jgi:hypothetical protein
MTDSIAVGLSVAFRWTNLRAIGNSGAVKSTLLIPIIGYILIFSPKVAEFLDIGSFLGTGKESYAGAVPTRLLITYFGLCLLAAGSALYIFFCPAEIKEFPSPYSYVLGVSPITGEAAVKDVETRLSKGDFQDRVARLMQGRPPTDAATEAKAEYARNLLSMNFEFLNSRHRPIRIAAAIAYIAGFILLGALSAQVFFRVLMLLVQKICLVLS